MAESTHNRPILFISCPRTTSNLLMRILDLASQPNVITGQYLSGYHFLSVQTRRREQGTWDTPFRNLSKDQQENIWDMYRECFQGLEKTRLRGQEEGKLVFTKEHINVLQQPTISDAYAEAGTEGVPSGPLPLIDDQGLTRSPLNCTIFSDGYLSLWRPMFMIRHPIKTFPSFQRVKRNPRQQPQSPPECANLNLYKSLRDLYDFYTTAVCQTGTVDSQTTSEQTTWPIVLEADDYMQSPALVEMLARATGLDPSKLRYSWDALSEEEIAQWPGEGKMVKTLLSSKGIERDKLTSGLTIEEEIPKWIEEFGEGPAKKLADAVEAALPDYEYLRSRRIRL